jgi:hypothetical protein
VVLLVNKPLNVPKRDLRKRLWTGRKEELEIQRIVRERMGGVVTALEIRPEVVDRLANDIVHVLCSLECLARLDLRHGLGVLRALGGVIDLGVAQRQRDRAMAHELFHHCERGPGIEELRRKGMPQGIGLIGLYNSCPLEILRHAPLDGTDTHGRSWEGGTRKQHGHGRPLSSPPLAQHLLQIRRDVHDSIDASFAVVHPDSALGPIDGRPGEARDLAHAQATPQHEQKHGAIPEHVDDLEKADQVVLGHGPGQHLREEHGMTPGVNRLVGQQPVLLEEGAEAPDHAERGVDCRRCQAVALRCLKPGIHIGRGQAGHILPEGRSPRWGQQPIERDQSSQGGLQRFRAGVADAEVDEVLRYEVLVAGTDKGQPVERRGVGSR